MPCEYEYKVHTSYCLCMYCYAHLSHVWNFWSNFRLGEQSKLNVEHMERNNLVF